MWITTRNCSTWINEKGYRNKRKYALNISSQIRFISTTANLRQRRTKMSHAHLRDGLPFHFLQDQIFPPAALKMRMMLVGAAQHGSGPGHCQQLHIFKFMRWKKISHRDLRLSLFREMLARSGHGPRSSMPIGPETSPSF